MSIASSGDVFASAAGSHLAQTTGVDVQRIQQDMANHQRQIASDRQADDSAGIVETDGQDHETHQRDADGRRPWEIGPPKRAIVPGEESSSAPNPSHGAREQCGQSLDLTA